MSDAETVANGLSDSDTLSDNERVSVGRKAPPRNPIYTTSIGRAVNRAFYISDVASEIVSFNLYVTQEKPKGTYQQKFQTSRVKICPRKHLSSLTMFPETYLRNHIPGMLHRNRYLENSGCVARGPN